MKTLKDHVILYDEACPMCQLYTKGFVKAGMLDQAGRAAYQQMPEAFCGWVDTRRAVNEIALVDKQTGKVLYGIESLFAILQHAFPVLKPLFKCRPFAFLAAKAYGFISYNRRVILPAAADAAHPLQAPAVHTRYRSLYILLAWLVTSSSLFYYSSFLNPIVPASNFYRELVMCGGQVVWQLLFVRLLHPRKAWDYLGNMMTISLAGAILLLGVAAIGQVFSFKNPWFYAGGFGLTAGWMLLEHLRRTRLLQMGLALTATWVLYRLLFLFLLF